jgi:hypothetical protein
MKTLDEMINELTILRDKLGGNVQVFFDKNGCDDAARSITDIEEVEYFRDSNGEFFWTSDNEPENYQVNKLVRIYSDRSSLFDNLGE